MERYVLFLLLLCSSHVVGVLATAVAVTAYKKGRKRRRGERETVGSSRNCLLHLCSSLLNPKVLTKQAELMTYAL